MRWAQVNGQGSGAQIVGFANDEKGLLMGVNGATPVSAGTPNGTNSVHASNLSGGDPTLKDPSNRPFYPALYVSDITGNPNATTGQFDFQNGGSPVNLKGGKPFIDDAFGAWSTATITNGNYQVTPPPAQNHWTLGTGSDQPVGTTFAAMGDEGYGAEVRWNASELTDGAGNALAPGHTYRVQILTHDGDQNKSGGDAGEFCVTLTIPALPKPTIVTHATSGNVGDTITDSATVSAGNGNPTPTGSVTFKAYSDSSCTNLVYTDTESLNGGQATAAGFKPGAGTYYWVDTYSGDGNYAPAGPYPGAAGSTACSSDPLEKSTVNQKQPSISTSATSGLIGGSVQDTATVSGGSSPTGTVSFTLYSDASCHTAVFTDTEALANNGQAVSKSFTPNSAGNYFWIASYSGDTNNKSATGTCGDQGETSTITPKQPSISTSATSGLIGDSVQDTATVSGGSNPTGTVSFTLYSDASCHTAVFTDTETLGNNGQAVSKSFTPSSVGNYYWIASYSGDTNNKSVSGNCGDQGETSNIGPRTPTLTTNAVGAANGNIHDTATLTGGFNPTGKITWNVYDQTKDPTCTAPLNNNGAISVTVTGDGTFRSPDFPVSNADEYVWVATYSGDANNVTLTTSCNDPNEVSPGTPNNPAIKLIKLEQVNSTSANGYVHGPVHGLAGDTVDYQMTVINTGNTDLVINFTDQQCDSGTLSAPSVISGNYNAGTKTLSSGGELQYTCLHVLLSTDPSPFVNTANVVGTVPNTNQTVSDHDSVNAFIDTPGIKVIKLQRDGTSGAFTPNDITASVGDTIYYEIRATNTGNVPLKLSLTDPHCDSGTIQGPFQVSPTLTGDTLSPGGVAQYTCWHVASAGDEPSYTNVGTITGTPPSGPPVRGHGIVVAHITHAAIQAVKLAAAPCSAVSTTTSQPSGILPCNGSYSQFTTGIITVNVPSGSYSIPIEYQIRVTNTGNTPLALSLDDPLCNPGSIQGPTQVSGTLNGTTLSPGGQAFYTCTHTLTQSDGNTGATGQPFTNTATVTGTPPSGPPVHTTTIVTVHRTPAPQPFCIAKHGARKGKKIAWPKGTPKPQACRPAKKPPRPRKPHHPSGFTG